MISFDYVLNLLLFTLGADMLRFKREWKNVL